MFITILPKVSVNYSNKLAEYILDISLISIGELRKELFKFYKLNKTQNCYTTYPLICGFNNNKDKYIFTENILSIKKYILKKFKETCNSRQNYYVNILSKTKLGIRTTEIINETIHDRTLKLNEITLQVAGVLQSKFENNILSVDKFAFNNIRLADKYISRFVKPLSNGSLSYFIRSKQEEELRGLYRWRNKEEIDSSNSETDINIIDLYYSIDE